MCFSKLVEESWGMWNPIKQTFWVWWMVPGTSDIGFPGAWCPPFSHRTGAHQSSRQAVHSSLWWGNHQLWASWPCGEASEDHRFNGWRLEDPINLTDQTDQTHINTSAWGRPLEPHLTQLEVRLLGPSRIFGWQGHCGSWSQEEEVATRHVIRGSHLVRIPNRKIEAIWSLPHWNPWI